MLSIWMQIFFSVLFFAFHFIDAIFIPVFKASHKPSGVTTWLKPHQSTCLYTSLLFTFTVSLAVTIYQIAHESNGFYTTMAVVFSISISYLSLLIMCLSCYQTIARPKLVL